MIIWFAYYQGFMLSSICRYKYVQIGNARYRAQLQAGVAQVPVDRAHAVPTFKCSSGKKESILSWPSFIISYPMQYKSISPFFFNWDSTFYPLYHRVIQTPSSPTSRLRFSDSLYVRLQLMTGFGPQHSTMLPSRAMFLGSHSNLSWLSSQLSLSHEIHRRRSTFLIDRLSKLSDYKIQHTPLTGPSSFQDSSLPSFTDSLLPA